MRTRRHAPNDQAKDSMVQPTAMQDTAGDLAVDKAIPSRARASMMLDMLWAAVAAIEETTPVEPLTCSVPPSGNVSKRVVCRVVANLIDTVRPSRQDQYPSSLTKHGFPHHGSSSRAISGRAACVAQPEIVHSLPRSTAVSRRRNRHSKPGTLSLCLLNVRRAKQIRSIRRAVIGKN